uniref:Uncharacterized protein n=1 Tax=Avena sativa TaxID=4498 RepID=A0ACD5TXM4_AVESA
MDPDEVDSAGIYSHDRLTGNPPSSGGGGGSWGCRLLRRGCDLARKAAIAGAVATAAPFVAPPLIVLSAAGVALSVPFAAYLASLAATNYLTGALLHSCYPPPQPYHHHQEDDDVEQEFLDAYGHLGTQTELGKVEEGYEGDTLSLLPRDHGVSEAQVPAFVDQVGGEFSHVQESGLEPYTSDHGDETEEHTAMDGMEPTGKEVLPGGVSVSPSDEDNNLVQKEGEGEFSVLDSGQQSLQFQSENFGFPDPRVPASDNDYNVVQEKGEGRFSVQNSGQQSFQSDNWNEKEEDGKTKEENKSSHETPSEGFYLPEPRVLGSADKDNVVQDKGEDEFSAQNLGQYSLLSNTEDEKEQDMTMEEKKSTEDVPPRDFVVSESPAPVLHGEDDVVPTNEGFEVPVQEALQEASSDSDLVIGEVADVQVEITPIAASESEVLPPSDLAARESPVDLVTGEVLDVDVGIAAAVEPQSEVLQPTSESQCDPAIRESVDVQVDRVGAAAPGSKVLPLSSLTACESQAVAETAHVGETIGITVMEDTVRGFGDVNKNEDAKTLEETKSESMNETVSQGLYFPESRVPSSVDDDNVVQEKGEGKFSAQNSGQYSLSSNTGDKNEQGMTMEEKKSTEDIPPRDFVVSEPPAPVLHAEDDVVPTNEGFEVAVQEVLEEANSDTDLVIGKEAADVQVEITAIAAPESEILPQSNLAARDSPVDLVTGEVVDVDAGIAAAAEPESEVLQPTSESQCDPATRESVDVQVDMVSAAVPGSEVLPLSSLAACESQAIAETAHVGETTGITVMEDTVRDFGDVSKKEGAKTMEENKSESTNETVPQGFYFPELRVPSSVDEDNVVQEKGEGEFSAQNSGDYSLLWNTGDKNEQGIIMEENKSIEDMPPGDSVISASSVPVHRDEDNVVQSKERFEVAVQEMMGEANSTTDLVMGEVADGQVEIIAIAAPETEGEVLPPSNVVARELPSDLAAAAPGSEVLHPSNLATSGSPADPVTGEIAVMQVDIVAAAAPGREVLPLSSLADFESEAVAENAHVGEVTGITVMEDIVRDFGDVSTEGVSFVSVESVHDGEDVMSSGTTPYFSTMEEEMIEEPNQSTGVGYAMMNEAFGSRTLAGGEAHYTEELLREQLDTIRTITGYGAVSSPTLEGELAGLYIFVGVEVEPAVGAVDTSDRLMELNAKLRFLKSIIGVD